jgi:DNA polymerase III subunit delta
VKCAARDVLRDLGRADPARSGVLLFGPDPMRIALLRRDLVAALLGPDGESEMRLTRLQAADLRRDPAALIDALKAVGFFPGHRVVLVEDAGEGLADPILAAFADWRPGDAELVVTAGALAAKSRLRKGVEVARSAFAVAVHADLPGRAEVEAALSRAGLSDTPPDALAALTVHARAVDPGDFAQFVEKLALYKRGDPVPLTPADVLACAPLSVEADIDEMLNLVAESETAALGVQMQRLAAQGASATGLMIGAARHFRTLHSAAVSGESAEAALGRARPPVFGARRDRMAAQVRRLGPGRLERALALIMDTDLALRSARPVPGMAMVERTFIRIAMLAPR